MTKTFDNNLIGISKRYAKALLEVAQEKQQMNNVLKELKDFNDLYTSCEDLRKVLLLPTVSVNEKKDIIEELAKTYNASIIKDFLFILADEGRFNIFETFYYCFLEEYNIHNGIVKVEVNSVVNLSDEQKNKLTQKLEDKLGKKVQILYSIKPELIGGMVVSYNSKTIDLSLKNKFESLKQQLN